MADELDTGAPAQEDQDQNQQQDDDQGQQYEADDSAQQADAGEADQQGADGEAPEPGFSKKQLEQLGSWMGRMVKKQIHSDVLPILEQQRQPSGAPGPTLEKFNEELLNQMLSGDVIGALDKVSTLRERAQKNLTEQKKAKLVSALTQYSDDPDYREIYKDAEKIAEEAMARNVAPDTAAELAITKARLMKLQKMAEGPKEGLAVAGNGKRVVRAKVKPLPKQFANQCKRDIADGIFKDEAEYRANLSSAIKRQYGL